MASRYCKHGNRRRARAGELWLGVCPECANAAMAKLQRGADRARFKAQLARIRGER